MTDPKNENPSDDMDWANALDEWEQKAFGSVHPPAPTPEAAPEAPSAEGIPTPIPTEEPEAEGEPPRAAAETPEATVSLDSSRVTVDLEDEGAAVTAGEVEFDESELAEEPPRSRGRANAGTAPPPAPPVPPPAVKVAPHAAPSMKPAERKLPEAPRGSDVPRPSVTTGSLRSLSTLSGLGSDGAVTGQVAMPGAQQVGTEVAALLEEQATWLEAEAGAAEPGAQARMLLALSEIRATLGDRERAHALATRARDLDPQLLLAHRQARSLDEGAGTLHPSPDEAPALAAEEACASRPAAKRHAALMAANALRLAGDADGAMAKNAEVAATGDIRGLVGQAAFGLAQNDVEALTKLIARPEAGPIAAAVTSALRLRGAAVGSEGAPGSPEGVTDAIRAVRQSLSAGEMVAAAERLASLRAIPELADGAVWLASALAATTVEGRGASLAWLLALAKGGDRRASRVLAARAVEAGDAAAASAALALGGFSSADEVALSTLLHLEPRPPLDALPPEMGALGAAVAAATAVLEPTAAGDDSARAAQVDARAGRVVGTERSRSAARMARLLATKASVAQLESALGAVRLGSPDTAGALELELALREGAHARVADLLQGWTVGEPHGRQADPALAAALVAERAGDPARALSAYRAARALDPSSEVALRALASLQASSDLPGELNELANDLGATVQGALARLEAVIREDSVDDATRADLLERSFQAAPSLPLASYLAERIALRNRNTDEVLRWIGERRAAGADPVELVVDGVREARLVAQRDPDAAAARIAEAHQRRPDDVGLREAYERTLSSAPDDRGRFWEALATSTTGDSRARLYLQVAHEYERAGDTAGILRVTEAAGTGTSLVRLARERAELEGGEAAQLVDQLLAEAKSATDEGARREAYERLAEIDGVGRGDPASALLWHRSILEETGAYLPSLRYLEHALIGEGRDDELSAIAAALAHALAPSGKEPGQGDGGERVAHADLAARLRGRGAEGDWDSTFELAELAAADPVPSLTSLRLLHAHARARKDDALLIRVSQQLLERATRPVEMAALRLRLAEAAFRQNDLATALTSLEQSTAEDPGDLVAYRLLAEVRDASGDTAGAAEAHESVARLSLVPAHQLDAWYDAARLWLTDTDAREQAVQALEQAAAIDLAHEDVFVRLSEVYSAKGAHADLALLLERRIAVATTPDERVTLEVDRARALIASGDRATARIAVAAALAERPDHTTALATFGDLSALEEDWEAAEDAWVRLARLLATPEEQRTVYERLGELYSTKAVHLERAELAFKEVLKRAPDDIRTLERLVDVYRRQRDVGRAVEVQQEILAKAATPAEKRNRTIELALLHEDPGHDERRAEQVLEGARREFPTDVAVLRALAEFYARHKQTPALNILLDRTAADARRAFAAGRFAPALFELMRAVFELRGQGDAAHIVGASLLAIEGKAADVPGGGGRALDPRLDDLLAPDVLSSGLRTMLERAGSMLDVASPMDLRAMGAQPAGPDAHAVQELASSFASALGLAAPKIYVSRTAGRTCVPATSEPPTLVIGEALLAATNERAVAFMVMRAIKILAVRGSALVRATSTDLAALVPAWFQSLVPGFAPQGINPTALAAAARKIALATPPPMNDELVSLGLEVASQLGTRASTLGGHVTSWANRAALLGVGDPNAALEAIAWSLGNKDGAPADPAARTAWIGRTHEAKDLLIFSVGDAYAEARSRLDLRL